MNGIGSIASLVSAQRGEEDASDDGGELGGEGTRRPSSYGASTLSYGHFQPSAAVVGAVFVLRPSAMDVGGRRSVIRTANATTTADNR